MKMTVTIDSATIGAHQVTEPKRDFTDSADGCVRVEILPAEFARLVRAFFFLLNLQPWQLICDQSPIARSRQRWVLFRRVSLLIVPGRKYHADRKKSGNCPRHPN
jgi:hypothetical protein